MNAIGTQLRDPINSGLTRWCVVLVKIYGRRPGIREEYQAPDSALYIERMSRLTRDGTAKPVSRNQILRRERGQGIFPCSADHKQDWQPYAVDLYSAVCHCHIYMYTYIVLSRVPSTPACYRGTLGFKEKSECICCGHASGIFSPRPLWFGGCATHATPCLSSEFVD